MRWPCELEIISHGPVSQRLYNTMPTDNSTFNVVAAMHRCESSRQKIEAAQLRIKNDLALIDAELVTFNSHHRQLYQRIQSLEAELIQKMTAITNLSGENDRLIIESTRAKQIASSN